MEPNRQAEDTVEHTRRFFLKVGFSKLTLRDVLDRNSASCVCVKLGL